jgi:lipopolysaccharide export system protein LptA
MSGDSRLLMAFSRSWKSALLCSICALLASPAFARIQGSGFSVPDYWPNSERLRTIITGDTAATGPGDSYVITGFKLQTFPKTGATNVELTVAAPDCLFDQARGTGSSPGPIQIDSGDARLHIEGAGYLFHQIGTNLTLDISNHVRTVVHRETPGAASNSESPALQPIIITSDFFHYERLTSLITYTGHVHAGDDQTDLACDTMTVLRKESEEVRNIVGDGHVVITSKSTGGQATGDHAVYAAAGANGWTLRLSGNPRWQDGSGANARVLTGDLFIFDRPDPLHSTLRSEGNALLLMPRSALNQSGLFSGSQSGPAVPPTESPTDTNSPVRISADLLAFKLPPTNGPVQAVTAENHVVIFDPADSSRATADHADFSDVTGLLQLTGNPVWQAGERIARGDLLVFDRTNQSFAAFTNAFLRLPATALGQTNGAGAASPFSGPATNRFVEVTSGDYFFEGGLLTFHDHVHAEASEDGATRAWLDSSTLRVLAINHQLQSLEAQHDVHARVLPVTNASGIAVQRDLFCDLMDARFRTNSVLQDIVAGGGVHTLQTEFRPGAPVPVVTTLDSDTLKTLFLDESNTLDRVIADRNVFLTQATTTARGGRLVYTASNDVASLTDHPIVVTTNGTLNGDPLELDRRQNKFYAWGYVARIKVDTNRFGSAASASKGPR